MANTHRPLSPHLQIYRPQLTSVLSVTHRATGIVLSAGIPFLLYWIWALTAGPSDYQHAEWFFGSILGRLLLLAFSFSLFYHLCNGVRHLFWDMGRGLELRQVYRSGWLVVIAASTLTVVTWLAAYAVRGYVA